MKLQTPFIGLMLLGVPIVSTLPAQTPVMTPEFRRSPQVFQGGVGTWGMNVADIDSDGDLDIVLPVLRTPSLILLNDGKGMFSASGQALPNEMHGIAIGDVDRDGDLDLFFAPVRDQRRPLFLNDGHGMFQQTALVVNASETVALIDLESDGDLDAYLGNLGGESLVWKNDGRAGFTRTAIPVPGYSTPCDLNGDKYVDFVGATGRFATRRLVAYINYGLGGFQEYASVPKSDYVWGSFDFADVDSDGDNDVLWTNGLEDEALPSGVLLNDGTGRLSLGTQPLASTTIYGYIRAGDLNGDGLSDMVVTNSEAPAQVWLNIGRGRFEDSGIRLGEGKGWADCALEDLDGDGDLDVFIVDRPTGHHGLWFNDTKVSKR